MQYQEYVFGDDQGHELTKVLICITPEELADLLTEGRLLGDQSMEREPGKRFQLGVVISSDDEAAAMIDQVAQRYDIEVTEIEAE